MDHAEMVALIRDAVPAGDGIWADLGAGTGNFTRALRELLGPGSTIYAVDRDGKAIARQQALTREMPGGPVVRPMQADFTRPLDLPALDGILMANALHFIRDQQGLLATLQAYPRPGGRLVLVEYDVERALPWVPYPVPFARFQELAPAAGLTAPTLAGSRRSPSSGTIMYAAITMRQT
jgi:SAM-dependent methyltransferase